MLKYIYFLLLKIKILLMIVLFPSIPIFSSVLSVYITVTSIIAIWFSNVLTNI